MAEAAGSVSRLTERWLALLMATHDPDKMTDDDIKLLLAAPGPVTTIVVTVDNLFGQWLRGHADQCRATSEVRSDDVSLARAWPLLLELSPGGAPLNDEQTKLLIMARSVIERRLLRALRTFPGDLETYFRRREIKARLNKMSVVDLSGAVEVLRVLRECDPSEFNKSVRDLLETLGEVLREKVAAKVDGAATVASGGDAPLCNTCGQVTVRSGSCYRCPNHGAI